MPQNFGALPDGRQATLYTISADGITAKVCDFGASLVQLWIPNLEGIAEDVVLGFDDVSGYANGFSCMVATIGRNTNRIKNARFTLEGEVHRVPNNFGPHNLHSGPDFFQTRLWKAESVTDNSVTFFLHSPHGDQGFPGNADIRVRYTLENCALTIAYEAVSDAKTVFNMTNHSYFNLAGHNKPKLAMEQVLTMPAEFYTATDWMGFPTGELKSVAGTPMDFRTSKPLKQDIRGFFKGYDHNFVVKGDPCAVLYDPHSGRTMTVSTDCPGLQVYTGGGFRNPGKGGASYGKHCAVCLESQFFPDAVNHPQWPQPFFTHYKSQTTYRFTW